VFGQHPKKSNLAKFFSHPIIQILWKEYFLKSSEFEKFQCSLRAFGTAASLKLKKHFEKVESINNFSIIEVPQV
jgi:hypothetical protein